MKAKNEKMKAPNICINNKPILGLFKVCVEEQVDPEDLESLIRFAQVEQESSNNLSIVIMAFFRSRLKMQE